jgi:chromate transport protein ChrA
VRADAHEGGVGEVFVAFVKLGLTSFGGPIAHLGYFRDELVVRRKWLDEAIYAVVALLLPGMLLVYGTLPFWDATRARPAVQAAMLGTNAAVVRILGAALYNPVSTSAVLTPRDFALALAGFLLLTVWNVPPWIVVVFLTAAATLSRLVTAI